MKSIVTKVRTFCVTTMLAVTFAGAQNFYIDDTDWGGGNLTLENGDVIAGVHTNIGVFTVPFNAAATVMPYGPELSDPIYSNDVVIGYATTNYYGRVQVFAQIISVRGSLSASASGYPESEGPGAGKGRTSAGYGGHGTGGRSYGSPNEPFELGSGGGTDSSYPIGGAGGGAIMLAAEQVIEVDGSIEANGENGLKRSGGGSGGSIWLRSPRICGEGAVRANGGGGPSTYLLSAGGGRIAFDTAQNDFNGIIQASPGEGHPESRGTCGTFNFASNPSLDLVISNDIALPPQSEYTFKSLKITDNATLAIQSLPGTAAAGYLDEVATHLRVLGDVLIESGSTLSAHREGYWTLEGPGGATARAGASHGGRGATGSYGENQSNGTPGECYGSASQPDRLGSGGGDSGSTTGNTGGGAVIVTADGVIDIQGTITATGGVGHDRGGGGSGGSVWLTATEIRGQGLVSADGGRYGMGRYSGSGGGGRIAFDTPLNNFKGTISAEGKPSTHYEPSRHGTFTFQSGPEVDLVISNPIALPPGDWVFKSLTVTDQTTFEIQSTPGTAAEEYSDEIATRIRVVEDVVIEEGSRISADALGYPWKQGPGGGTGVAEGSSGGAHGGYGGTARERPQTVPYGDPMTPDRLGSGGGGLSCGGGAIILDVGGSVVVDGELSAKGETLGQRDGGGAGGSIWIKARRLTGNGRIIADGGEITDSLDRAGGGGGGRVAIDVRTDLFTGIDAGLYLAYPGTPNGAISITGGYANLSEDGEPGSLYLKKTQSTLLMVR